MVCHAQYCMHLDHKSHANPNCSCTSGRILPVFPWSNDSLSEETWLTSKFNQKRGFSIQVCIGIITIGMQGMLSDPHHFVFALSLVILWFQNGSSWSVACAQAIKGGLDKEAPQAVVGRQVSVTGYDKPETRHERIHMLGTSRLIFVCPCSKVLLASGAAS